MTILEVISEPLEDRSSFPVADLWVYLNRSSKKDEFKTTEAKFPKTWSKKEKKKKILPRKP